MTRESGLSVRICNQRMKGFRGERRWLVGGEREIKSFRNDEDRKDESKVRSGWLYEVASEATWPRTRCTNYTKGGSILPNTLDLTKPTIPTCVC